MTVKILSRARAGWVGLVVGALALLPCQGLAQTAAGSSPPRVTVQNFAAQGNLAVTHALTCTTFDKMKTDYTPADIYPAFADCVANARYQDATQLFMLAGAYSAFDTQRVADVSAHDAKTVLVMQSLAAVDPAKKAAWQQALRTYITGGGLAEGCAAVRRLGPPTYYPAYMIQHGMAAFQTNPPAPLVEPFDAAAAWQSTLTTYLQCPA